MTTESRHVYVRLSDPEGSFALLSDNETTDTAVIFVHGFGGDPHSTWLNFQGLIDQSPARPDWWGRSDVFFYRYESVTDHIFANGERLLKFIGRIFPSPDVEILQVKFDVVRDGVYLGIESNALHRARPYCSLVLAGHSEGGLVIRQTILSEAQRAKRTDLETASMCSNNLFQCKLKLFAPALLGVSLSGLVGVLAQSFAFGTIIQMLLPGSRAYADMKNPVKINELKGGTEKFAEAWPNLSAFRANILWGEKDSIVTPGAYSCDKASLAEKRNHISICKPGIGYPKPLEFVSDV
jgi:pimeloyl-ACP methyl ester carboxylesterase